MDENKPNDPKPCKNCLGKEYLGPDGSIWHVMWGKQPNGNVMAAWISKEKGKTPPQYPPPPPPKDFKFGGEPCANCGQKGPPCSQCGWLTQIKDGITKCKNKVCSMFDKSIN